MEKKKTPIEKGKAKIDVSLKKQENLDCYDKRCNVHGNLKTRGKIFEGKVIKKLPKKITIEFERMIYIRKYERYTKTKTKIHARLPNCVKEKVNVGDLVRIQECRPLSKLIHFVFIKKINEKEINGEKKK
jgi:small subunit ribosomal protein S17